jgi:FdhD protein
MMHSMSDSRQNTPRRGVNVVTALRVSTDKPGVIEEQCQVVEEDALTIDIEDVGKYTLMWTPTQNIGSAVGFTDEDGVLGEYDNPEALALAAGFAFTEGIIRGMNDIKTMAVCLDEPGVVKMQLVNPGAANVRRRDVLITSSCGICGKRDIIDNNAYGLSPVGDAVRMQPESFVRMMTKMAEGQDIFRQTGGSHAAVIFSEDGEIFSVGEDLGRHNALDKVIGRHLLEKRSFERCGVLLSSRLSLEMAVKAVRAGFEIVAAVSAPTSLAVEVADRFGMTLCGFVRGERATVFTHPHRIISIP